MSATLYCRLVVVIPQSVQICITAMELFRVLGTKTELRIWYFIVAATVLNFLDGVAGSNVEYARMEGIDGTPWASIIAAVWFPVITSILAVIAQPILFFDRCNVYLPESTRTILGLKICWGLVILARIVGSIQYLIPVTASTSQDDWIATATGVGSLLIGLSVAIQIILYVIVFTMFILKCRTLGQSSTKSYILVVGVNRLLRLGLWTIFASLTLFMSLLASANFLTPSLQQLVSSFSFAVLLDYFDVDIRNFKPKAAARGVKVTKDSGKSSNKDPSSLNSEL